MALNVRELFPWFVLSAQTLLFFSVESWEMRAALVLVVLFQFWQKSRNYRNKQQQQQQQNNNKAKKNN